MRLPFFAVHRAVGAGNSLSNDIVRLKKGLTKTGDGGSPRRPSALFDSSASRSLKRFQTAWNLVPDSVVTPGGPSERTMDIALEAKAWGGDGGLKEVRAAHNALTKVGLAFAPDPNSTSAPGVWRDAAGNPAAPARVLALLTEGETAAGIAFDNVLRRDRVTGKHLLPGDRETNHDTMTGVTSPFWAPRKGPEFTEFVTRVFGGAPETAPAAPVKLAASAPSQPAGQGQRDNKPVEPDTQSGDTSSSEAKEDEIDWVPDQRIYGGEKKIKVKGPVKIRLQTNAFGIDGLTYHVDWQPLDKNGKVLPQFRGPAKSSKSQGQNVVRGFPKDKTFQPPYGHANGFEVSIWIPPQQSPHANSAGAFLDVFVPKGQQIK